MLPHVVPSANIFTFTWNSDYYKNAPLIRIQDVAGVLLSQLQSQRNKVESIGFWMNSLILGIGKDAPETANFHRFMLWGTHRHESQVESCIKLKKLFTHYF